MQLQLHMSISGIGEGPEVDSILPDASVDDSSDYDMPFELSFSCENCGNNSRAGRNPRAGSVGGWQAPNGQFYCRDCWAKWHVVFDPSGAFSGWLKVPDVSKALKNGSVSLCSGYASKRRRQLCDCSRGTIEGWGCCCSGVGRGSRRSPGAIDWKSNDLETPQEAGDDEELQQLAHLSFSDAHCHLDYCLLNEICGDEMWTFKKWICAKWKEGYCALGSACEYAHGEADQYRRPLLKEDDLLPFVRTHPLASEPPSTSSASSTEEAAAAAPSGERSSSADVGAGAGVRPTKGPKLRFLIHNCCEEETIADCRTLVSASERLLGGVLFCTFGCHPHNWDVYTDAFEQKLLDALRVVGRKAVGWGECGLDYFKNFYDAEFPEKRKRMIAVFARQARLAASLGLPLVVHTRDAEEDTLTVMREALPRTHPVHLHAFQGSVQMALQVLEMLPNSVVGLSGILAMKYCSEHMKDLARSVPLSRLVLETDAPYLSEDPAMIPKICRAVARLKGIPTEEVGQLAKDQIRGNCRLGCITFVRHREAK